jgi:hypothetical protein
MYQLNCPSPKRREIMDIRKEYRVLEQSNFERNSGLLNSEASIYLLKKIQPF